MSDEELPAWWIAKVEREATEIVRLLRDDDELRAAVESDAVQRDVDAYPRGFRDVDASIRTHAKLGSDEPWNTWHWPRRVEADRRLYAELLDEIRSRRTGSPRRR